MRNAAGVLDSGLRRNDGWAGDGMMGATLPGFWIPACAGMTDDAVWMLSETLPPLNS